MRLAIVGGCFATQHNIPKGRLYHETLVSGVARMGVNMTTTIIRYERFATCLDKIIASHESNPIHLLIFHLRTEPPMRLAKLYYFFIDNKGKLRRSLNLPALRIISPEKYDVLSVRQIVPRPPAVESETRFHHMLREANYRLGAAIGNTRFAMKKYFELVVSVNRYCREQKIKLIVVGPVSRPLSRFEDELSAKINKTFRTKLGEKGVPYIETIGVHDETGEYLFFENGIHVNQRGHDRIAGMLLAKIKAERMVVSTARLRAGEDYGYSQAVK